MQMPLILQQPQQYKMGNCSSQQAFAPISADPPLDPQSPPQPFSSAQNTSSFPPALPNHTIITKPQENCLQQNLQPQFISSPQIPQPLVMSVEQPSPLPSSSNNPSQIIHKSPIIRTPNLSQPLNSSQNQAIEREILPSFILIEETIRMLEGVCFTENQAKDFFKPLIQGIKTLQEGESNQEKEATRLAFNQTNIGLIKNQKVFYNGMLDKLKGKTIGQSTKSRVYHTIANIKKGKRIEERWRNQHKITCLKSNAYKELSESELQEVVFYETLADKIREIGQKIGFKFQSIKEQSEKMVRLLTESLAYHIEDINQLKYDLSESQVMKMAKISRQACNYYENGVYILLVYFVQSCKRLEKQSRSTQEIEYLLQRAIEEIYKQYPPGEGLSKEREELIQTLKKLQNPKNYNKVDFQHQEIKLTSTNKQRQVEEIITKYAKIAEQSKDLFEKLIKATCLSKCIYFKIGLKYYPSKPNQKALTRIKQKMFFKKEAQEEKKVVGSTVKEVLQKEQTAYRSIIDQILKNTDNLQFKISDMVRGKCVFLDVGDIIETVNEIKKFVAKNPRYGISEIESRFTNTIPISDVTLKIVLNKQIVAELQLTIQTNAATYNFAHKIYELHRSKVFSKLKIIHNYYQESRSDFGELAKKALQLQIVTSTVDLHHIDKMSSYFGLDFSSRPFRSILQEVVEESRESIKQLKISVDPDLQHLFLVAFNLSLGQWGNTIGKIINQSLKQDQLSPKLKSVILSIFFEAFQLPTQSAKMQQHYILNEELSKKIYLQEYLKKSFQIQGFLQYSNENQRLFQRILQLKQVIFYKDSQPCFVELKEHFFVQNLVIQAHCFQKIKKLKEYFYFYFLTRKDEAIYYEFSYYSKWIEDQLKDYKNPEVEIIRNESSIIKAQYLFQQKKPELVKECLEDILKVLKSREQHTKVIQCQILLAQSFIKTNSNNSLQKLVQYYEKNVIQKASVLGLELKGPLYADSLWRISQYLWQKLKSKERKQLLKSFSKRAIIQMSRSKGKEFVQALSTLWKQYESYKMQKPQMNENKQIKYANLSGLGAYTCRCFFSRAKWKNINSLNLMENKIGSIESKLLSQADWKNITKLNLSSNNIGTAGCQFISKADWKNLAYLSISQNDIRDEGCQYLSKADWKYMRALQIMGNYLRPKACQYLSNADWKDLKILNISYNEIGVEGCYFIKRANWKKLANLIISKNEIGDEGCLHLSQADWKDFTFLQIYQNQIGDLGCQHLSQSNWKFLTTIKLDWNKIGPLGCQHFSKAEWKSLVSLSLHHNNVGEKGCQYLSKADWKNLSTLDLNYNSIGDAGCQQISKARWQNLKILKLHGNQIRMKQAEVRKLFTQKNLKIN